MLILTIRTDKPEAEIGLFDDEQQLAYETWLAHRQLAETINLKLKELLRTQHRELGDLQAIVLFKGPGSFTGLRIGASVANALADSLKIPIIGGSGEDWLKDGCQKIVAGQDDTVVLPEYGAPPHITQPKH